MLVRLLKFMMGYVIFTAKGGFSERFINLCAGKRIDIWDVSYYDGCLKAKIGLRNFKKLRSVARKTGVKISILSKKGVPFYLREHRDRAGVLIGVAFFITFSVVMNRFVWCINAADSEKFSREQIMEAAQKAGLHHGVYVADFDEEKAAREIYKAFEGELSWVKVNIKGSLAAIEFRDGKKKLGIEEKGQPSNVIADFDGVILSDETYQGAKNISKGNAVKKGDILISGVVEGIDMKPLYYEAKGKFTALHTNISELKLGNNCNAYSFTNIRSFYTLSFFGLKIPLGIIGNAPDNCLVFSNEIFAEYDGHILPFGIRKTVVASFEKNIIPKEKAMFFACMNYSDMTYDKYKNTNILSSDISIKSDSSGITVSGEYKCIDFIGESKPIIIENIEN